MAISATFRQQTGTPKVFKSSGGTAAITLASLASGTARQSAKLDLGATIAPAIAVKADFEFAATPTAGTTVELYWAPSSSATAGTDNPGGVSGTDSAYAGYSANLGASALQLTFLGSFVCTTQATATVQKMTLGVFRPANRYGSLVVVNNSGASFHSSDTNSNVTFTPLEEVAEA
jgi:hypothetical protein